MEIKDLKKTVDSYIDNINKKLHIIESDYEKLKAWKSLKKSVTENVQQTDESVLKQMINHFGTGCLKRLIEEVATEFVNDYEYEVNSKMVVLTRLINNRD